MELACILSRVIPVSVVVICLHCVQAVIFHASFKSGEKPGGNSIACAAQCALEATCVGYEMSNASGCVLLTIPPDEPKADHWIYANAERMAQFRICPPVAARASGSSNFYLYFEGKTTIYKYGLSATADILAGNYAQETFISNEFDLLEGKNVTAMYQTGATMSGKKNVHVIIGEDIEVYDWSDWKGKYALVSGYPRPLAEELGVEQVPASVNAMNKIDSTVYMLENDMVYEYEVTGLSPEFNYTFVATFDITVNSVGNPFSAAPDSPVATPPGKITALASAESGGRMLAFSGKNLYVFYPGSSHWDNKGEIMTPCG